MKCTFCISYLCELQRRKDQYIDLLHGSLHKINKTVYSSRTRRMELEQFIENQEDLIEGLKLKLFQLRKDKL